VLLESGLGLAANVYMQPLKKILKKEVYYNRAWHVGKALRKKKKKKRITDVLRKERKQNHIN